MTEHSSDKNNWREKYLNALDEQEQLEKKCTEQQALLRAALVRVSIAADGQDDVLDELLAKLREQLRSDMSAVAMSSTLLQLERAALTFEQQREQNAQTVHQALLEVGKSLQRYTLSSKVKKDLHDYLAQLSQRSKKKRLYPALLKQLASIQQRVLEEIEQPKQGFLARFLSPKATPALTDVALKPEGQVFDLILPPQQRMAHTELMATSQTIGSHDVVTEAYLAANQAFANYLKNVNQELAEIYALLGGAVKNNQQKLAASRQLQHDVIREMSDLENDVSLATDINQLKDKVKLQIGNIREVIDRYQQSDSAQDELAQQLAALSDKIKTMEQEAEKNRTSLEQHRHKALHDPLTDLPNREAYNERAMAEVQRWQRYGRPLTVAIFDIDHFKKINDNFGHQAGDRVIKVIGRSIAKRLREVDFFCRYGGEEFVAFMPETDADAALVLLEKVRAAIAGAIFNYKSQELAVTISIGVTEFAEGDDLHSAFERADKALYRAKSGGRNRCELL